MYRLAHSAPNSGLFRHAHALLPSRARNFVPPLLVSRCEACRPQDYVDYSGLKKAIKNVRCHPHRAQRSPSSLLIARAATWPFILFTHMALQNLPMSAYFRRNPNPLLLEQKGACGLSLRPPSSALAPIVRTWARCHTGEDRQVPRASLQMCERLLPIVHFPKKVHTQLFFRSCVPRESELPLRR
jgi:hypothetical protein